MKKPVLFSLAVILAGAFLVAQTNDVSVGGRSTPRDMNDYNRAAVPSDLFAPLAPVAPVIDLVINNTDPNLKNTDLFNDGEPSIAINPLNVNQISITAFSGSRWQPRGGPGAPVPGTAIWTSTDAGNTWTKTFSIQVPPDYNRPDHIVQGARGCPCDQTIDYDRNNWISGVFLTDNSPPNPPLSDNIYTATALSPALQTVIWGWFFKVVAGTTQRTNQFAVGDADQPWLLVNRDTVNAAQDNIYVAYDDFSMPNVPLRVAVSKGAFPPDFSATDQQDGQRGVAFLNPGHRLATDPRNGWVYAVFQSCVNDANNSCNLGSSTKTIQYVLNRSQDGGLTWTLNGNAGGIVVATAKSDQPNPKFGTVNALLGGVDHVAVDPVFGDVYVVYGDKDTVTGNNRLSIKRLTDNGAGGLNIGVAHFVTGQVQAALPSVAVANDPMGTVAVLYDTFDGFDVSGFPRFTAHLAMSGDKSVTFGDQTLLTFLSSAKDNGNTRQRVLGDYQQLKAVGNTFYGTFTANGAALGRLQSNMDPMFFKFSVSPTF